MKPVITLTTDFGDKFADSQLRLVIHSIAEDITVITNDDITPYSILEGGFILSQMYSFAPKGSVHVGVVDPGVGSERRGVVIKTTNYYFIGPDNGLFYPAAQKDGIETVYRIESKHLGNHSNTFHGRDVFAKLAACIVTNSVPEGVLVEDTTPLIPLTFKENQVVHIDAYGNIKLFSTTRYTVGDMLIVSTLGNLSVPYVRIFVDVPLSSPLFYHGSHDTLEFALHQASAAKKFGLKVGDILEIQKS